jgi:hypothetical protein
LKKLREDPVLKEYGLQIPVKKIHSNAGDKCIVIQNKMQAVIYTY